MDNIKIIEFNDDNFIDNISESILKALFFLKNKSLLITNRNIGLGFIDSFADSLYTYNRGVVLIERLFKKDKCKQKGEQYSVISSEDKDIVDEFVKFSSNIPEISSLTPYEKDEYIKNIHQYESKISSITPKVKVLDVYKYDNLSLVELDLMTDEDLSTLSLIYSNFYCSIFPYLTWGSVQELSIAIKSIDCGDFIDLVLIPIKTDN